MQNQTLNFKIALSNYIKENKIKNKNEKSSWHKKVLTFIYLKLKLNKKDSL